MRRGLACRMSGRQAWRIALPELLDRPVPSAVNVQLCLQPAIVRVPSQTLLTLPFPHFLGREGKGRPIESGRREGKVEKAFPGFPRVQTSPMALLSFFGSCKHPLCHIDCLQLLACCPLAVMRALRASSSCVQCILGRLAAVSRSPTLRHDLRSACHRTFFREQSRPPLAGCRWRTLGRGPFGVSEAGGAALGRLP